VTRDAERRSGGNGAASKQADETTASLPAARALLLPATGRRHWDVAIVLRCPWCHRSHLHRGGRLNGAVRASGCNPAREYQLAVKK
jgi:hypothetical protein